jgi:hypothetical protein
MTDQTPKKGFIAAVVRELETYSPAELRRFDAAFADYRNSHNVERVQPSPVSPAPQGDPWAMLIERIQSRAMVAGQCSVEEPDNPRAEMAAAEAEFLASVADTIERIRKADAAALRAARAEMARLKEKQASTERFLLDWREYAAKMEAERDTARAERDALRAELADLRAITEPWQAVHYLDPHQCVFGRFHPVEEVARARQAERAQWIAERDAALQRAEQAEQREANLHDILSGFIAATDPEDPHLKEFHERAFTAMNGDSEDGCGNPICAALTQAESKLQAIEQAHQQLRAAAEAVSRRLTNYLRDTPNAGLIHEASDMLRRALSPQSSEPTK